jgi:deoxyhypusine synthase
LESTNDAQTPDTLQAHPLQKNLIDRIYDTLADEEESREADEMIGKFAATLDQSRAYSTREFLYLLGKQLAKKAKEDGIVTAAVS